MARVEILMLDDPPTFTVDLSQTEVNAAGAVPPAGGYGYFQNAIPRQYFTVADHIKLLAIMLRLPYCFSVSTGAPRFVFSWEEDSGPSEQTVSEIGGGGWVHIPLANVEFPLGDIKAQWDGAAPVLDPGNKARIMLKGYDVNISMVGVPPLFDQTDQEIQVALRLLHTEDMIV